MGLSETQHGRLPTLTYRSRVPGRSRGGIGTSRRNEYPVAAGTDRGRESRKGIHVKREPQRRNVRIRAQGPCQSVIATAAANRLTTGHDVEHHAGVVGDVACQAKIDPQVGFRHPFRERALYNLDESLQGRRVLPC